jgi:hypothetical protein
MPRHLPHNPSLHIIWSEILLPIENHHSLYAFTLVNQDLTLILFFVLAHKKIT